MKRYKIIKTVWLDFLTPQDQVTLKLNDGIVEWEEGKTPWYVDPSGKREMTINYGWLIQKYIKDGRLIELT